MSSMEFKDAIKPLIFCFESRMNGDASDIRERIALIDFYIRVLYLIIISESRSHEERKLKVIRTPGFGTMFSVIKQSAKNTINQDADGWAKRIQYSANCVSVEIDKFKVQNRYKSFKSMRDQLSHGHALPVDEGVIRTILEDLKKITNKIQESLNMEFGDSKLEEKRKKLHLVSGHSRNTIELSPLWSPLPDDLGISVYSHFSQDAIYYMAPGGELHIEKDQNQIARFTKELLGDRNNPAPELGRLVNDTLRDVSAFTEDYSIPSFYFGDDGNIGNLYIPWTRSTSDGNQSRIDSFRIGQDNRREWWNSKSESWIGYSEFMRNIANWPILARRIGIGLDNFSRERKEEEVSRLGISQRQETRGPAKLKEVEEDLQQPENDNTFDLRTRVDEACQRIKPFTSVFFLVGQAGLGKTDLMLSLARNRALEIAENPCTKEPLYLFVSSTGRTLASLEDAVNSSLNITKLLSSHGAKALCRNGLLVLLVDGFDELLGSSGYQNALGSLEPWFKELGGRGVLVASARSSYYLTQYRKSLAEIKDINVDHTLIELQPWSRQETKKFLLDCGLPEKTLKRLSDRDWDVLSVPFFSKAFSAWLEKKTNPQDAIPSIFNIVVDQYLERESLKLEDPHQGPLLVREELQKLFSEIAEMMQVGKIREIEQSDLIACAQQAIGADSLESNRPGLSRRLSSLCGLGVDRDATKPNQFGFSHDVMFDCFLSSALQRNIASGIRDSYFKNILEKSKINTSVFEWMLQANESAVDEISNHLNFFSKIDNDIFSENMGALWCTILAKKNGIPPTNAVKGLRLGTINLADAGWSSLTIEECKVERLLIPAGGNFKITLVDSKIEFLDCDQKQLLKTVQGLGSSQILSIHTGTKYEDNRIGVRKVLSELGLIEADKNLLQSPALEAAEYYLDRIKARPEVPIVVAREDNLPDDPRLSWTRRLGDDTWQEFVDNLTQNNLARLEIISTSGKPKCRLIFHNTPASILNRSTESSEILKFWNDLAV